MWFKHPAWRPVAWLLSIINLGAVWFAAQPGEPWHATAHALLAALFALGAQHLTQRSRHSVNDDVMGSLEDVAAQLAELGKVQGADKRLPELEERLDFIERALVEVRNRTQHLPKT